MTIEPGVMALLVGAAFVAAFIDSIVGGGGVITLPALLAAGLPPHMALGTNKLAATGASLTASIRYTRAGLVIPRIVYTLVPLAGLGAFFGAWIALQLQPALIRQFVIGIMILMTAYVVARRQFGREHRFMDFTFGLALAISLLTILIGTYDGVLGPGTGTFLIFAFVGVLQFDFLRAASHGRVLNLASNAGALAFFALNDRIDYSVGLPMLAAMLAGAWIGSHYGIRHGTKWIKPMFVAISIALLARLVAF